MNLKNGLVPGPIPPTVPSIRVLVNDGTGRFPTSLEQVMPQSTSTVGTYSLEHADLNGDGWLDIFVINWGMPGNGNRDAVLVNSRNPAQLFTAANVYFPEFPVNSRDGDGDSFSGANATPGFPALRVGQLSGPATLESSREDSGESELRRDVDHFAIPARAITEGGRVRLKPAPDSDLKLTALDVAGNVVSVSDVGSPGATEQIDLAPGTAAVAVQIDRQSLSGVGTYRLDLAPVTGLIPRVDRRPVLVR